VVSVALTAALLTVAFAVGEKGVRDAIARRRLERRVRQLRPCPP
jgi:hypothetical protein